MEQATRSTQGTEDKPVTERPAWVTWALRIVPIVALIVILGAFLTGRPLDAFTNSAPPIEELSIQRVIFDANGIKLNVINSGANPVTIAQVVVDDAFWTFSFEQGSSLLGRLQTAVIRVPYPWVSGEAHNISLVTTTGVTCVKEILGAISTPWASAR